MIMTTQLRRLRLRYHITLDELANAVGTSNQYLSALEQGKAKASSEQQKKISSIFLMLAEEHSRAFRALDDELLLAKDCLFTLMEVEGDEF